jgi:hypothetical protein
MTTWHTGADDVTEGGTSSAGAGVPVLSVGGCYRHAWRTLLREPVPLLVMGFGVGAVVALAWALRRFPVGGGLLSFAFGAFVSTPLAFGFQHVCLRAVRGEPVLPRDLVAVFDRYREAVVGSALWAACVFGGLMLFVVPGVFALCRLAFVPFLLVGGRLRGVEAIQESFQLTDGYGGRILGLFAVRILLYVASAATLGLGFIPAMVLSDLALASFYYSLVESRPPPGWDARAASAPSES